MRLLPAVLLLLCLGCSTTAPLQTASVLAPGRTRLLAQAELSPWCSFSGDVAARCSELPEGVPLPELRVTARRGLTTGLDSGLSARANVHLPPGSGFGPSWRGSLGADLKWQFLRRPLEGEGALLLAVAPALTFNVSSVPPRNGLELTWGTDLAVPLLAGLRLGPWELVGNLGLVERLSREVSAEVRWMLRSELEVGLGLFGVEPAGLMLHLGYRAPLVRLGDGPLLLTAGWMFDLG